MIKPGVSLIVCGRFHYHKFVHLLSQKNILSRFIYSYKLNYYFDVPKEQRRNAFLKEYLMYAGRFLKKSRIYHKYLSFLHSLWQQQIKLYKPQGNIGHFLLHGNCSQVIRKYKSKGIKIIGEVVNAHPHVQNMLLTKEYGKYGLAYESGDKYFEDKIIAEYSLCDHLLVPSVFLKQSLISNGVAPEKVAVIPYGLNKAANKVKEAAPIARNAKLKLLCVSQITFRKGIIYLCEALELLLKQGYDCHLTLVGMTDPLYEQVIGEHLAAAGIRHIPHIDNAKIENLMVEHDLLIMPSIEDGFGIVVSEALSVHLPVIVTSNCGAAEVVRNGKDGFVIEPFSAKAIADAVAASIEYKFEFSGRMFTWEDYVIRLEGLYSAVLN
jgi:glycosyltransferase involved in cell wall biosynthesis